MKISNRKYCGTSYKVEVEGATGILQQINGKFTMGKFKSSLLS